MNIRLHHQHGLNPTVSACFFCGGSKNELALLGAAYKGEAPRSMVLNMDPCDVCNERMAQGVAIFECEKPVPLDYDTKSGKYFAPPPYIRINESTMGKLTGRWWVITREAAQRAGIPHQNGKTLIEPGVAEKIGLAG